METDTVTLRIKDHAKLAHFMKLIKELDYVEILPGSSISSDKISGTGDDLFALAGIWEGRDISAEDIREKAWPKRI